jgi:hypothetical protein
MTIRPMTVWTDPVRSQQVAVATERLMSTYNEAIAATYHLHGFRVLGIGGLGRGHSWIDMVAAMLVDVLAAVGLFGVMALVNALASVGWLRISVGQGAWAGWLHWLPTNSAVVALAAVATVIWAALADKISQRRLLSSWLGPLILRLDPKHRWAWQSSIVVLGRLVREEVIRHVRINLNQIGGVLSPGVELARPRDDSPASKAALKALETALQQVKAVRKNAADFAATSSIWSKLLDKIPWKEMSALIPTAGLSWGLLNVWGGVGLCLAWVLAYHILAFMGLVFFDSALRKNLFFDGRLIKTSDDIKLTYPPVSKQEKVLYDALEIPMPSVQSWAIVYWPPIHYVFTAVMIVVSFVLWRQSSTPPLTSLLVVGAFGANILYHLVKSLVGLFR